MRFAALTVMVGCPQCTQHGKPVEAAVEISRWTATGAETRDRCPRCGWEKVRGHLTDELTASPDKPARGPDDDRAPAAG